MTEVIEIAGLVALILGITEFLKRYFALNGLWTALVVTLVVGGFAVFFREGITYLTVTLALLIEVFSYQVLKETGVIASRNRRVGSGGGYFRPR
jgi:uncharacterized membrane-anchored protein